jgi:hypothetical protein
VALVTRFEVEELDYLRGLPTRDCMSIDEMATGVRTHWVAHAESWGPSVYGHVTNGYTYLRHGEMLAKFHAGEEVDGDDELWAEAAEWLERVAR